MNFKKLIPLTTLAAAAWLGITATQADAHFIDETAIKAKTETQASYHYERPRLLEEDGFTYEDYYPIVAQYQGKVLIESRSTKWDTQDKLKALETELLKNKHGEELKLLGKITIYPDYPEGDGTLGQYFAEYQITNGTEYDLLPNRRIELYGGDDFTTPEEFATTLAHEYGHHFTFYHLLEGESKTPQDWLDSTYAKQRDLDERAHSDGSGDYEWMVQEVFAEDYVQLFGSETALENHVQMNPHIDTPFDDLDIQDYWVERLPNYETKQPIPFYISSYEKSKQDPAYFNLEFYLSELEENTTTYIRGRDGKGVYMPVLLDAITQQQTYQKWFRHSIDNYLYSWLLDSYENPTTHFQAIQPATTGFNRGSQTIKITYASIQDSVTTEQQLNLLNQPTMKETKELLHAAALKYNIPPEIIKALAYVETGMKHFNEQGELIVSEDGRIGMMQVPASTLTEAESRAISIDSQMLATDINYNIDIAAKLLNLKWESGTLPTIANQNKNTIEHWYFVLMSYNGLSNEIFKTIETQNLIELSDIPEETLIYDENNNLVKKQYDWSITGTQSSQTLQRGDMIYTGANAKLRSNPEGTQLTTLQAYTPFKILAGPFEKISKHYVMYKVQGNGLEGYIASPNVTKANVYFFPDIKSNELAAAVNYLAMNKLVTGYDDGTFKPYDRLLRRHAAKLLVNELGLSLPAGYKPKATDIKPGELNYNEMIIAEAHGLMGQGSGLRPNEHLTRAQMAAILVRAYNEHYFAPTTNKKFTDQHQFWNYKDINTLAYNNITVVNEFKPNDYVTRGQFALFLTRSLLLRDMLQ
ncbi:hypothetical protein EJF36_18395 [Bacillus sp. HMF5848]|uniref:S-layer homology domain-containing protein n=1 Tax=Bacillus sp. HMF5848 TaxID=2495421 RepID=UPI000F7ABF00|nr:S-layer homology domain-containing protein [Bacillus sp. HMF5848]RSK28679.1 hypothetical protein EJF36_18395 [Bacillus sp. HMF5848]